MNRTSGKCPRRWGGFLLLCVSMGLMGCSSSKGTVTGKVYYKDEPLKGGNVLFISTGDNPSASAQIEEDGSYTVEGITAGDYKITVETESLKPLSRVKSPTYSVPSGIEPPGGYNPAESAAQDMAKRYMKIPERYADESTSGLTLTVTGGDQSHDIKLQ